LAELRMSGNVLLLPDSSTDLERYRLLMTVASTENLLAPGESLKEPRTYYGADRELGTELTLHRDFKPSITLVPVAVPERVTRFLPAVGWYRQEVDRQEVTKEHLPRALRVLDAIAREAARRGWELRPRLSDVSRHFNGQTYPVSPKFSEGQFMVAITERTYWLRIKERPGPGGQRIGYSHPDRRPRWQQSKSTEFIPTGRLVIESAVGIFTDHQRQQLEEVLASLFRALEARAACR